MLARVIFSELLLGAETFRKERAAGRPTESAATTNLETRRPKEIVNSDPRTSMFFNLSFGLNYMIYFINIKISMIPLLGA